MRSGWKSAIIDSEADLAQNYAKGFSPRYVIRSGVDPFFV